MSEKNTENMETTEKKKISLQDAIKQQLANKKNQASAGSSSSNIGQKTKKMQSQQTKKVSNQRRKMGV